MTTPLDKRRLRDGEAALALDTEDLSKLGLPELLALKDKLFDGAVALQSLDDLGSEEANAAAWSDMTRLSNRLDRVKDEITKRGT